MTQSIEVCDETCLSSQPQISCYSSSTVQVYTPSTGQTEYVPIDGISVLGSLNCSTVGAKIYSMTTTSGSFVGFYGLGDTLSNAVEQVNRRRLLSQNATIHDLLRRDSSQNVSLSSPIKLSYHIPQQSINISESLVANQVDQRLHRALVSTTDSPSLSNPISCLSAGSTIVFDISKDSYPVYVKDSLLNTNDNFDYSLFRELQYLSTTSQAFSMTSFSFTFTESGTYVFKLSSLSQKITIIRVVDTNIQCGTSSFVEFSNNNLILLGIVSNSDIVVSPDWNMIIGLLSGMLGVVLLIVSFLYYFRKKAWSTKHAHGNDRDSYRANNKNKAQELFPTSLASDKKIDNTVISKKKGHVLDSLWPKAKNRVGLEFPDMFDDSLEQKVQSEVKESSQNRDVEANQDILAIEESHEDRQDAYIAASEEVVDMPMLPDDGKSNPIQMIGLLLSIHILLRSLMLIYESCSLSG